MQHSTFENVTLATITSLAKRRGFIFIGSDIYGGLNSVRDYGPAGISLKRCVRAEWWKKFVDTRPDVVGMEAAILMHPDVWSASGHIDSFEDLLHECGKCHKRYRAENVPDLVCPDDKEPLSEGRSFNLMFETHIGTTKDTSSRVFLRPETAQGIFVNFDNIMTTSRLRLPAGIAQIGKSFRNEITPGHLSFRMREFEQMELEFFCLPETADEWYQHWIKYSYDWLVACGIRPDYLRLREHGADELPHYALASTDIEYKFPWGWGELETIANRSDHDLKAHSAKSGKDLSYFDAAANQHIYPYVVEPAMGSDRIALAFLFDAYDEEEVKGETRVLFRFHPDIAPFQVAVLPLSRSEKILPTAHKVHETLLQRYRCLYDESQSIGKRYRRQDEIGTPLCVTIDFDTVEKDNMVTIRNRDSMSQIRTPIDNLAASIDDELAKMRVIAP